MEYRRSNTLRPIVKRKTMVRMKRRRRGRVSGGPVETVYSTVVGDGLRVRRYGETVSMAACVNRMRENTLTILMER